MDIAIITGASSGIGKEFVLTLDRKFDYDEIWVIARRKENLEALCPICKNKIRPIPLDLTKEESYDELRNMLNREKPTVKTLVNAGGFGLFHPFQADPTQMQLKMIDLNNKALVAITHIALEFMNAGSEIFNIASTAAFQPVPYEAIYGATKAFVLSFSRALNVELRHSGIKVLAVCPHWCKTEFFNTAVKDDTICYYNLFNDVKAVVETAVKDMKKGKDVSLCDFRVKAQIFFVGLLPKKMVMKTWCRQQKKRY